MFGGRAFADTVNYKYDDAGRLTSVAYADGTVIAYSYDNAGNLLSRNVTRAEQQSASGAPKAVEAKPKPAKRKGQVKRFDYFPNAYTCEVVRT